MRLLLAIVAVYFVLGLTFRSAIAVNAIAVIGYAVIAVSKSMPAIELTHYVTTLLFANVICVAGAYNLEHARRTAWLEGQRLAETAMQDGLTGIHNRRRFDEHLQRAWAQSIRERKPIALLFADIDHFKAFNDRYGHQAGDEAMKSVAGVLSRFARRPLDLAARYGGEEFAIILFDTRREQAEQIGEEIMEAVRQLRIPHAGFRRGESAHDQHGDCLRDAGCAAQLDGGHPARRPGAVRREGRGPQPGGSARAGIRAHADRLLPSPRGDEGRRRKKVSRSRFRAGRRNPVRRGTSPRC